MHKRDHLSISLGWPLYTGVILLYLQVLQLSKYFLLQMTSPDAVYRLQRTPLAHSLKEIQKIYFQKQHHSSIEDFLNHHMHSDESESGLLMQVNKVQVNKVQA